MTRDPLALTMLAAWLNVTPEQLPEKFRAHECDATMAAWQRVGEAAVAYVAAHPELITGTSVDEMLDDGMRTAARTAREIVQDNEPSRVGLIHNLGRLEEFLDRIRDAQVRA